MVVYRFTVHLAHTLNDIRALCEIMFHCFQSIEDITMMTVALKLYVAALLSAAAALFRMVDGIGGLMYIQGPIHSSHCYQTELYDTSTKDRHALNQAKMPGKT